MNWMRAALGRLGGIIGPRGRASGGASPEDRAFPSRPPLGEGEDAALSAARAWLETATARDAAAFALGEERRFTVDQARQELSLSFADGESLALHAEALGSFNPRNRTFRWAWSNRSLDPDFARASEVAKVHPDVQKFPSFRASIFEAKFEDCRDLVALAAERAGCAGVYRAITEDHVSVFLGYRQPSDDDAARLWRTGRATAQDVSDAERQVLAYDAAMFPFDAEYEQKLRAVGGVGVTAEARLQILNEISLRQYDQHRKFWRPADDDGGLALSWPSPHDQALRSFLLAIPRRAGGVYVVRCSGAHHREAFILQRFDDGVRIIDRDIDWGAGLMLP